MLLWSENGDGVGGVGGMVKEDLFEKVVKVRRVSDGVVTVVLVFKEDVLSLICWYAAHSGGRFEEKLSFCDECDDSDSVWVILIDM